MFSNILVNYLFQIVFTLGIIVLFGFLVGLVNRTFYANLGGRGSAVCYITGFLGTPVHELSHALFCLIFGHKITEIKLFQVGAEDGTLGYVSHTYNRRNFYQRLGNFFIGIAPILGISGVLYLLAYLLTPAMTADFAALSSGIASGEISVMLRSMVDMVTAFFSYVGMWQWWVFVALAVFLSLHMTLSKADISGALSGLLFVLLVFFVIDLILGFVVPSALNAFTDFMLAAGGYLFCFMSLGLITSLVAMIVSFIVRWISRRR